MMKVPCAEAQNHHAPFLAFWLWLCLIVYLHAAVAEQVRDTERRAQTPSVKCKPKLYRMIKNEKEVQKVIQQGK